MLNVIGEFTHEALAIRLGRKLNSLGFQRGRFCNSGQQRRQRWKPSQLCTNNQNGPAIGG